MTIHVASIRRGETPKCVLVGCSDPTGGGKSTIMKHENGKTASRGLILNDHITVGAWTCSYEDDLTLMKHGHQVKDQMHWKWSSLMPEATALWSADRFHLLIMLIYRCAQTNG